MSIKIVFVHLHFDNGDMSSPKTHVLEACPLSFNVLHFFVIIITIIIIIIIIIILLLLLLLLLHYGISGLKGLHCLVNNPSGATNNKFLNVPKKLLHLSP